MKNKKNILIFSRYYLPGYRAGGPIRSIHNLVKNLEDDFNFKIVCLDKDHGVVDAYDNIKPNTWNKIQNIDVFYMSSKSLNFKLYQSIISQSKPDLIYLNSFFDRLFSMIPLLFALYYKIDVLLAPRGEFTEGALEQKILRKNIFLKLSSIFGLYKNMNWHSTSDLESDRIKHLFSSNQEKINKVSNLPETCIVEDISFSKYTKLTGHLKIVLVGRISKMKNILVAVKIVKKLVGQIQFDIIGVCEDEDYLKQCLAETLGANPNVKITFLGEMNHDCICAELTKYDIMFMPTLGENFGHAIIECLSAGLPVVISDRTPWKLLRQLNIGTDIALENESSFVAELQKFTEMSTAEILKFKTASVLFSRDWQKNNNNITEYKKIFTELTN